MKKIRLDQLLIERKIFPSREQAQRAVMAGDVFVSGTRVDRPAKMVDREVKIEVKEKFPYVSRGALKLKAAVEHFGINFNNKIVADIGASTGGFTDLALTLGAKQVFAIDVGYGQLAAKLRSDPRVFVMEKTNIRYLKSLPKSIDIFTIDVSFISLKLVLPVIKKLCQKKCEIVALIKPQFEASRSEVSKGHGVIKDPLIHQRVVAEIEKKALDLGFKKIGAIPSPILGPKGNREFLLYLLS
jgi:23S rRNA (cytidine1920-2'-O)/16S rRNA (cytidine1409-2'-O)-methyltransferase